MTWNPEENHGAGLATTEPGLGSRTLTDAGDPESDWLCAWCHHRVANDRDRFFIDGQEEFTFTNPEGLRFAIRTFSEARGGREAGIPTLAHTWFPGHAWSFCQCGKCGQHLGWFYSGPQQFAGLIRNRIVRGVWMRN